MKSHKRVDNRSKISELPKLDGLDQFIHHNRKDIIPEKSVGNFLSNQLVAIWDLVLKYFKSISGFLVLFTPMPIVAYLIAKFFNTLLVYQRPYIIV